MIVPFYTVADSSGPGMKPDVLPILRQDKPTVLVDPQRAAALKLELPAALLQRKTETARGLWEIGAAR